MASQERIGTLGLKQSDKNNNNRLIKAYVIFKKMELPSVTYKCQTRDKCKKRSFNFYYFVFSIRDENGFQIKCTAFMWVYISALPSLRLFYISKTPTSHQKDVQFSAYFITGKY